MKMAPELDLLVNTVPSLVLDCKTLSALRRDCLVIDIASAPYGTDFACARELGLNVIVPGSLPGKTAPKTAGEIIADAILNIIKEELMKQLRVGFALCGSFCTLSKAIAEMRELKAKGADILPIMSENAYSVDTRFGKAEEIVREIENICGKPVIHTITDAEPIGPKK